MPKNIKQIIKIARARKEFYDSALESTRLPQKIVDVIKRADIPRVDKNKMLIARLNYVEHKDALADPKLSIFARASYYGTGAIHGNHSIDIIKRSKDAVGRSIKAAKAAGAQPLPKREIIKNLKKIHTYSVLHELGHTSSRGGYPELVGKLFRRGTSIFTGRDLSVPDIRLLTEELNAVSNVRKLSPSLLDDPVAAQVAGQYLGTYEQAIRGMYGDINGGKLVSAATRRSRIWQTRRLRYGHSGISPAARSRMGIK